MLCRHALGVAAPFRHLISFKKHQMVLHTAQAIKAAQMHEHTTTNLTNSLPQTCSCKALTEVPMEISTAPEGLRRLFQVHEDHHSRYVPKDIACMHIDTAAQRAGIVLGHQSSQMTIVRKTMLLIIEPGNTNTMAGTHQK